MNGMRVTVEMGQEEFIAFVNFQKERPQLMAEIKRLKDDLQELAEEVDWAITEENEKIKVNPKIAKDLLKIAGKYL